MRLRSLLWLVAMAAFLLPSFVGPAVALHRMDRPVASGCADDAPPPCPEKGTAQHAAGLCCPAMSEAMAVLPRADTAAPAPRSGLFLVVADRDLVGLSPHQDPPPPRV